MTRELKEHGLLFTAPMVRAILAGTKTRKLYPRPGESPDSPEHLLRRLANGATLDESTGCWVWTRAHNNFGYGTMTVAKKSTYVHRLAYRLLVGEIPAGLDLHGRCGAVPVAHRRVSRAVVRDRRERFVGREGIRLNPRS